MAFGDIGGGKPLEIREMTPEEEAAWDAYWPTWRKNFFVPVEADVDAALDGIDTINFSGLGTTDGACPYCGRSG